ncbi:ABC transporter ATP-binding protein [Candidatus Uabimicrobium amorphum]|uniref:Protein glycosylation K n=1 Tax=Uabimicrobium amorphum TaxID=2596890 RepID=A0A5S9INE5_UABAM|nr:ABC transporter ATP-binding protein [Candidatus Uabimicrobium amorphum]BBM85069.1 protein glycosylation K [Candidatus Uabimicrobium amorphum]
MRENKMISTWRSIKAITTYQDRKYIYFLGGLSFLVSIIESIGISLVVPFIALVQRPDVIFTNRYFSKFATTFSLDTKQVIVYLGIILIAFYIGRALFNTTYYFLLHKFSSEQKHKITVGLFCHYLRMPYKDFLERNSSVLMKNIDIEAAYATQLILHFLYLFSEFLTILLLYSILIYVNWQITVFLTIALVVQIFFLEKCISPLAKSMGEQRTRNNKVFWRVMKDSFANFKMLKILSRQEKTIQQIENVSKSLSRSNAVGNSIGIIPRNFLETTGIVVVITIMICSVYFYGNATSIITTISIFFLALYRILPALNRILTSYNQILFTYPSLEIIADEFAKKYDDLPDNSIEFTSQIELRNVCFHYASDKPILQDVSFCIPKNSKVAFVGESGSGKTTLIDLIIALYTPNGGQIYIDNEELTPDFYLNWRKKIGYIPQDIYLFDGTLAQNISLCLHSDEARIIQVLHQTNLFEFFASREGLETKVGDGGVKLSGGQKQRVGIARALYNDPEILVLDEATSALDEATEKKIIDEIYNISKNKTIFIVTHRLSTIQNCEFIYEIKNRNVRKFVLSSD